MKINELEVAKCYTIYSKAELSRRGAVWVRDTLSMPGEAGVINKSEVCFLGLDLILLNADSEEKYLFFGILNKSKSFQCPIWAVKERTAFKNDAFDFVDVLDSKTKSKSIGGIMLIDSKDFIGSGEDGVKSITEFKKAIEWDSQGLVIKQELTYSVLFDDGKISEIPHRFCKVIGF